MTPEQKVFVSKLRRLLLCVPESLEIIVRHNSIDICAAGERARYFSEHGDADNVPALANLSTLRLRVYPGGESL